MGYEHIRIEEGERLATLTLDRTPDNLLDRRPRAALVAPVTQ